MARSNTVDKALPLATMARVVSQATSPTYLTVVREYRMPGFVRDLDLKDVVAVAFSRVAAVAFRGAVTRDHELRGCFAYAWSPDDKKE